MLSRRLIRRSFIPIAAVAGCLTLGLSTTASAQTGGATAPGGDPSTPSGTTITQPSFPTVPGTRAKLTKKGKAIPPAAAPPAVQNAIMAANAIRKAPYRYGGGHANFYDTGYDCSGAVSFALYGGGLLSAPMPSGSFVNWGLPGKGTWITVFANGGHMYAVIAGLRWDTSSYGSGSGKGPRWRARKRSPKGFSIRHPEGY